MSVPLLEKVKLLPCKCLSAYIWYQSESDPRGASCREEERRHQSLVELLLIRSLELHL